MKKKVGAYTSISKEYAQERNAILPSGKLDEANEVIVEKTEGTTRLMRSKISNGWIPVSPLQIRIGETSDDFIGNMVTVMVTQFIRRGPRILSNRYLYKRITKNLVKPKRSSIFGKASVYRVNANTKRSKY